MLNKTTNQKKKKQTKTQKKKNQINIQKNAFRSFKINIRFG